MTVNSAADHLSRVDASAWPGVATSPRLRGAAVRSRRAEAAFAKAASQAGLALDSDAPALVVTHADVFTRIAASGWIGLAEGYLAGEWETMGSDALVDVLRGLISAKYCPKTPRVSTGSSADELPADLISHFSGDGVSPFQGHFLTGVPTTQRELKKSYVRGAGHKHEPAKHFVDVTEFATPMDAGREDLSDAQARSAAMLLDAVHAATGTHLQIRPAAGSALAVAASRRGVTVDCVANSEQAAAELREHLTFAGVADAVRVETAGEVTHGAYDAIVSVEHLETLPDKAKGQFLRLIDQSLVPSGVVSIQTVVCVERLPSAAMSALESLRAYIWPGLSFSTSHDIAKITDRNTGLRIIAETRAPEHLAESLALQRRTFEGNLRDAAADGFDVVYRRLWIWQLALREALAREGMLSLSQLTMVRRRRRGR
ncbi:cyclopropane-fatty-acyl-phospholipid synthase family protein [Corynebacterium sp. HMSC29G08]|uniref:SAM-dependent methyltransferase n=1 Tax=Corynebacterium sp. HMSC29G08 TaxID=1581069 RepID=UPI0008A633D9|nr:class I SAM-dependent methyltransferase [Corynebacterium sp. HMSC29G08]OFT85920.1 hypothetical protein HMPREF3101_02320 [Corynebacterium sp. HMSC29G08]